MLSHGSDCTSSLSNKHTPRFTMFTLSKALSVNDDDEDGRFDVIPVPPPPPLIVLVDAIRSNALTTSFFFAVEPSFNPLLAASARSSVSFIAISASDDDDVDDSDGSIDD